MSNARLYLTGAKGRMRASRDAVRVMRWNANSTSAFVGSSSMGFYVKRGRMVEFKSRQDGAHIYAREVVDEKDRELIEQHEHEVSECSKRLDEARRDFQDACSVVVARAKPIKVRT